MIWSFFAKIFYLINVVEKMFVTIFEKNSQKLHFCSKIELKHPKGTSLKPQNNVSKRCSDPILLQESAVCFYFYTQEKKELLLFVNPCRGWVMNLHLLFLLLENLKKFTHQKSTKSFLLRTIRTRRLKYFEWKRLCWQLLTITYQRLQCTYLLACWWTGRKWRHLPRILHGRL